MLRVFRRREFSLLLFILFIVVIITVRAPAFFDLANFVYILNDTSILFMVGIAQMLVILTGGIDLSVASNMAFTGMAVAMINRYYPGVPVAVIVLLALGIGFVLGSFNGLLVAVGRIPPIITSLGTLSIYRGFVIVLSGGQSVNAYQMTGGFQRLPRALFLGLPSLVWFAVLTVAVFAVFLTYSRSGREIYAVGGSQLASRYVGIRVPRVQYLVFMLSGVLAGFGGLMWVARYASAQNDSATGFELETIAACVVGGVSIMGGSGSVWGVTLGALFLGIVKNALTQIKISPFFQQAMEGFVIVVAIVLNTLVDRRNRRLFARRILRE